MLKFNSDSIQSCVVKILLVGSVPRTQANMYDAYSNELAGCQIVYNFMECSLCSLTVLYFTRRDYCNTIHTNNHTALVTVGNQATNCGYTVAQRLFKLWTENDEITICSFYKQCQEGRKLLGSHGYTLLSSHWFNLRYTSTKCPQWCKS